MTIGMTNYFKTVEGIRTALSTPTLPITLFIGVFGLIIAYYRYRIHQTVQDAYRNYDKGIGTNYPNGGQPTNPNNDSPQLRSIQDFNKSYKDICDASNTILSRDGKENRTQKQFYNSTYYYAHNKYKRGGGYSDGLEAEDYTMNGPRLLSKNGISFRETNRNDGGGVEASTRCSGSVRDSAGQNRSCTDEDGDNIPKAGESSQVVQKATATTRSTVQDTPKVVIPITKYLWEDTPTISKIRIESLPVTVRGDKGTSEQTTLPWSEANIPRSNIQIRIRDDRYGFVLLMKRLQSSQEVEETQYLLHISNLYGKIDGATTVWKSHRLLVKLLKSDGYKSIWPSISSAGAYSNTVLEKTMESDTSVARDDHGTSCLIL
jgi:hypothetical protein